MIKRRLAQLAGPVLIFDPKHEYTAGQVFDDQEIPFLLACNQANGAPLVLRPCFDDRRRRRQFDRFCLAVLALAKARGRCVAVIDELHLLTDAGLAPAGWLQLVQIGRSFGVHIIAASIRPQSIDMDFRTNLTYLCSFRLGEKADCQRVASRLMVDWRELATLPNFTYYERDLRSGAPMVRGVVKF